MSNPTPPDSSTVDTVTPLQSIAGELADLLDEHQWAGFTDYGNTAACPECGHRCHGHTEHCRIAKALARYHSCAGGRP